MKYENTGNVITAMLRGCCFLILLCWPQQTSQQWAGTTRDVMWKYLHGAVPSRKPLPVPRTELEKQKDFLLVSAADIIHGTNNMVWQTGEIRMRSDQCVSFEVGFVLKTLEETYRRMLDTYNMTLERIKVTKGTKFKEPVMNPLNHLQKIEEYSWQIYHYHNMMHEIERKYKMDAVINGSGVFENKKRWTRTSTMEPGNTWTFTWSKRTTSWWRPLEYGWNTEYYYWK